MQRGNGGIVGKNNTPTSSTSTGVWAPNEVQRAQLAGTWPGTGVFNADSYAANLYLALSFTSYQSATTGGGYVDLSPQIRTAQGQTPGTAKTATQTGNSTINSGVSSPFTQYTNSLVFPSQQTSNSDLFYYSLQLGANQQLTVECWMYGISGTAGTVLATNNFGGGFYPAWVIYRDQSSGNQAFFTNTGPSGTRTGSNIPASTWTHVAWVFDGAGTLQMYVNGTRGYNSAYGPNAGQSIFTIGATNWDGIGNNTNVRFQDFRIYTGVQKYTSNFTVTLTNPNLGGAILR